MTFYECENCESQLMSYGEFKDEFIVIRTDSGLKCVCRDCDTQEVIEKFLRVRCEEINSEGTQCRNMANNTSEPRCPAHGGGKQNEI